MKRIIPLLLSLLLLAAVPAAAAEAAPEPQVEGPFLTYQFYEQPDWADRTRAVMFEADLDQDGVKEPVSFALDEEADATAITWGDSTIILEESALFVSAAVLDLDRASPFYNLLVMVDCGSDSYVTVELHPADGRLVRGSAVGGFWVWEGDALWFYERTDFLGTAEGRRTYRGDDLTPDSQWLAMSYVPTAEELATEREDLIEFGVLLHTIRPVPCTVDGQPSLIPADAYVYRTRFRANDELVEVCLPDGTLAEIACTLGEHGWPYLIDGQDMVDCFDNLFFAD